MLSKKCILQDFEVGDYLSFLLDLGDQNAIIAPDIDNLKSKFEEIRNAFIKDEYSNILVSDALEKINLLRKALVSDSSIDHNFINNGVKCQSENIIESSKSISIQEEDIDTQNQNEQLRKDNIEMTNKIILLEKEKSEIFIKLTTEKEEFKFRIDSLSHDLEQQIDECMELNEKLSKLEIEHVSKPEIVEIDEIINLSNKESDIKSDSEENMSILDLDAMQMESLCWSEQRADFTSKVEIAHQQLPNYLDDANQSCYNLENLNSELLVDDSNNMLEELDRLDWEDRGKIDLLIENSISIFMKSVLTKLDCGKNSRMEIQLKQVFSDYGLALSRKLRNIQTTFDDLNNTCVFEKLEMEMQLDVELIEIKKQLALINQANSSLTEKNKEILQAKEDSDTRCSCLQQESSKLASELNTAVQTLKDFQCRIEELENLNESLGTSTQSFTNKIEDLTNEKEEILLSKINCEHREEVLTLELSRLTTELQCLVDNIRSLRHKSDDSEKLASEELETLNNEENSKIDSQYLIDSLKSEISNMNTDLKEAVKSSQEEQDSLKESIHFYKNENLNLNSKHEELLRANLESGRCHESLQSKISDLTNELEAKSESCEILNQRLEELVKLKNDMETSSTIYQGEIQKLNEENRDFMLTKLNDEAQLECLKLEMSKVTDELLSVEEILKMTELRLHDLEKVNSEMEASVKTHQEDIQRLNIEKEEIILAKIDIEIYNESIKLELSNNAMELESVLEKLKMSEIRTKEFQKQNEEMETSLTIYRDEIQRLTFEKEEILLVILDNEANIESLKLNLSNKTNELDSVLERLKNSEVRLEDLEEINNDMKSTLTVFGDDIQRLTIEKEEILLVNAENETIIESLRLEVNNIENELDSVRGSLKVLEKSHEDLGRINAEVETSRKIYQDEVQRLTNEIEKIALSNIDIEIHKESLKSELLNKTIELESELEIKKITENRFAELQKENNEIEASLTIYRDEIQRLTSENQEITLMKEDIKSQIESLNIEIYNITSCMEAAQASLKISEERLEELQNINNEIETSRNSHQEEIHNLKIEKEEIVLANANIKIHNESLKSDLSNKTMELESVLEMQKTRENRLEELELVNREMETFLTVFKEENRNLKNRIEEIQSVNETTNTELQLSIESLEKIRDYIINININSTKKNEIKFKNENICLEYRFQEIEQEILDRLEDFEHQQTYTTSSNMALREEINVTENSVSITTELKDMTEIVFEKDNHIANLNNMVCSLEEKICKLETDLSKNTLIFESTLDDCIAANEKIVCLQRAMAEKDEELVEVQLFFQKQMSCIRKERGDNMEDTDCTTSELQDQLCMVKNNNQVFLNDIMIKCEDIRIKCKEVETQCQCLKISVDDIIKVFTDMMKFVQDLNSRLESLEILLQDKLVDKKQMQDNLDIAKNKIAEMEKSLSEKDVDIRALFEERNDLVEKMKAMEENAIKEAEDRNIEEKLQSNIMLQIANKLKRKKEQLVVANADLAVAREKAKFTQENMEQALEAGLKNLELIIMSKNNEIENLTTILGDFRSNKSKSETELQNSVDELNKKTGELESLSEELRSKQLTIDHLELTLQKDRKQFRDLLEKFEKYKRDQEDNKENNARWQQEIVQLNCELKKKDELLKTQRLAAQEYDMLVSTYTELKGRYREKRRRTDELNAKYERLVRLCRERGIVSDVSMDR